MDGIDRITDRIKSDAETESSAALASAKREAKETVKHFEEEAARQVKEMVSHGAAEANERLKRLEGIAELEVGRNFLTVKQNMIDAAFDRVAEAIAAYPRDEYIEFLARLAVRHVRAGTEQVLLSESDRGEYGEEVISAANRLLAAAGKSAALSLANEAAQIGGGLILRDGNVEVNCAIETILHFMRDRISGEVAEILFS